MPLPVPVLVLVLVLVLLLLVLRHRMPLYPYHRLQRTGHTAVLLPVPLRQWLQRRLRLRALVYRYLLWLYRPERLLAALAAPHPTLSPALPALAPLLRLLLLAHRCGHRGTHRAWALRLPVPPTTIIARLLPPLALALAVLPLLHTRRTLPCKGYPAHRSLTSSEAAACTPWA